jgi:hypothetical protein
MPDQEGILANDIIADKQILNRKDRAKKKEGKEGLTLDFRRAQDLLKRSASRINLRFDFDQLATLLGLNVGIV